MKLTLLEDGVLDYKGNGLTLAVPNAIPRGSLKEVGVKPAPKVQRSKIRRLYSHLAKCPACDTGKLCEFAENLVASI